jgi:hypothetical protein
LGKNLGVLSAIDNIDTLRWFAIVEQTLVSQLVIIPAFYYPFFYAVTGAVQGLTVAETMDRAKQTFIPLMKRNLLFWIPVQFAVFGFVDESLQIPILIAFGLIWTVILSVVAGSATTKVVPEEEESLLDPAILIQEDFVTGIEENYLIQPDDLFQAPTVFVKNDDTPFFEDRGGMSVEQALVKNDLKLEDRDGNTSMKQEAAFFDGQPVSNFGDLIKNETDARQFEEVPN